MRKYLCVPATSTQAKRVLVGELVGLPVLQNKSQLVRRERVHVAFPQGQHRDVFFSECFSVYSAMLNYNKMIAINSSTPSK